MYSKTCVKRPLLNKPKIIFQDQLSLNAGQKYYKVLQEHIAIRLAFIELPFVIKIFVLSIFEWPFYTGFTQIYTGFAYVLHKFYCLWASIYDFEARRICANLKASKNGHADVPSGLRVRKETKIRTLCNHVPHLSQDTT